MITFFIGLLVWLLIGFVGAVLAMNGFLKRLSYKYGQPEPRDREFWKVCAMSSTMGPFSYFLMRRVERKVWSKQ